MRVNSIALISLFSLGLAACGGEPADEAAAPGDAAESAAVESAPEDPLNANVGGMPVIRDGYWAVSTTSDGITMDSTMCVDRAMQERMSVFGQDATQGMCERATIERRGNGWVSHSDCNAAGMDMDVDMTITGDMRTTYRTEMVMSQNGQPMGTPHVSEGRYRGACPANMQPGDFTMGGGPPMSMDELTKGFTGG